LEGGGHGIFKDAIPEYACRAWEEPRKPPEYKYRKLPLCSVEC